MLSSRASERIVGASGILFVLGVVVGFGVLVGSVPGLGADADEIREFLERSDVRVWAGGYIGLLAELAFFVFATGVWAILRAAEGGTGWVSTAGLAAAASAVSVTIAGDLLPGAVVFRAGTQIDPSTAGLLLDAKHLTEMMAVPLIGLFLGCAAFVTLRTDALPRWAGWSAALIAAAAVIAVPLGYEPSQIPVFLAALWILVLSIRLLVRPVPRRFEAAPA